MRDDNRQAGADFNEIVVTPEMLSHGLIRPFPTRCLYPLQDTTVSHVANNGKRRLTSS